MKQILFRLEANSNVGLGHFIRSLTLARAAKKRQDTSVLFLMKESSDFVNSLLSQDDLPLRSLSSSSQSDETSLILKKFPNSILISDFYEHDSSYFKAFQNTSICTVQFDDLAYQNEYLPDFILNHNPYANPDMYAGITSSKTKLIAGAAFCLIRPELQKIYTAKKFNNPPQNVLITYGGTNQPELLNSTISTLSTLSQYHFRVLTNHKIKVPKHIELIPFQIDMKSQYLWADIVLTASGSTCWDILYGQIPFIHLQTADNQKLIHRFLMKNNLGIAIQSIDELIPAIQKLEINFDELKSSLSKNPIQIDTNGASRILDIILK